MSPKESKLLVQSFSPFIYAWRTGDFDTVKKWSDAWYYIAKRVVAARKENPLDHEVDPASSFLSERDKNGNPLEEDHIV